MTSFNSPETYLDLKAAAIFQRESEQTPFLDHTQANHIWESLQFIPGVSIDRVEIAQAEAPKQISIFPPEPTQNSPATRTESVIIQFLTYAQKGDTFADLGYNHRGLDTMVQIMEEIGYQLDEDQLSSCRAVFCRDI